MPWIFWVAGALLLLCLLLVLPLPLQLWVRLGEGGGGYTLTLRGGLGPLRKCVLLRRVALPQGGHALRAYDAKGEPVALPHAPPRPGFLKAVLRRIRWRAMEAKLRLGTGDAALDAWLVGAVWGVLAALGASLPRKKRRLDVAPEFGRAMVELRLRCIIRLRPWDILYAWVASPPVQNNK